uniref:Uncharacterized protein n=1 Tax=Caenorhabditis japonica TaxID=281687 RepID=A0A8R1IJJ8_CAEJA
MTRNKRFMEAAEEWKLCFSEGLKKSRSEPKEEPSVVVTLGIGLDVRAEKTLKDSLPQGSQFFAADPIYKGNGELFEPIGSYFPFAVGKEIDVSNALVLKNGQDNNKRRSSDEGGRFLIKIIHD